MTEPSAAKVDFDTSIATSHGRFWLTPTPDVTPYQTLLLCKLLVHDLSGEWMSTAERGTIHEATKEHWTKARSS